METDQLIDHIRSSAQLAAVLEVSGWPKPGNVHRTKDHSETRYEHFLAGSVILGSSVRDAATRGLMAGKGQLEISEIGIGRLVNKAVSDVMKSHNGGNTHLGVCLLFVPLAAAAAKTYVENEEISPGSLRDNVKKVMSSTTPEDAVAVYEAIAMADSANSLGKVSGKRSPDLHDKEARKKIGEGGISLFDVMNDSSSYDSIARELVTGMEVSFEIGYPELTETFSRTGDINTAIVHTFLRILSKVPDTFIARKVGLKKAPDVKEAVGIGVRETMWISETSGRILGIGGLATEQGKASLWEFDRNMQSLGKDYSPGTTADLTAASLMIGLLCGLRF